jgi:hypothetical protein
VKPKIVGICFAVQLIHRDSCIADIKWVGVRRRPEAGKLKQQIMSIRSASPTDFDVIVCGSLHLDIVVRTPELPRLDETVVGSAWEQVCGGKGGNQAVQASRAGARTAMIGRVGDLAKPCWTI